jgi:hypothetical protein
MTAPSTASTDALAQVEPMAPHPYVGMWVTADSYIHQELLANGRYDEARGPLQTAYTGDYEVHATASSAWTTQALRRRGASPATSSSTAATSSAGQRGTPRGERVTSRATTAAKSEQGADPG